MNPSNPYAPPQVPSAGPGPGMQQPPGSEIFAPCPRCNSPYAKRISWTFWGGALGPWMFTHVRCMYCGTAYNGKTGQSNLTNIVLYQVASLAIVLVLAVLFFLGPILFG